MSRPRLAPAYAPVNLCFWQLRVLPKGSPLWRSYQRLARAKLRTNHPELTDAERHEIMCVWSRRDCHLYQSPALNKFLGSKAETGFLVARSLFRRGFTTSGKAIPRRSRWSRLLPAFKPAFAVSRWCLSTLRFSHGNPPSGLTISNLGACVPRQPIPLRC